MTYTPKPKEIKPSDIYGPLEWTKELLGVVLSKTNMRVVGFRPAKEDELVIYARYIKPSYAENQAPTYVGLSATGYLDVPRFIVEKNNMDLESFWE